MSPNLDVECSKDRGVIIMANDNLLWERSTRRTLIELFPSADVVCVETIAEVYEVIRQFAKEGRRIAAIVSDEKFEPQGREMHLSISASRELRELRNELERVLGGSGSTLPIIIHSGGQFYSSPPAHAFFLDVEVWSDIEKNERNPLHRLLSIALGLTDEPFDKAAIRQTTEARYWGDKILGWERRR